MLQEGRRNGGFMAETLPPPPVERRQRGHKCP